MRVLIVAAHPDDEVLGCGGTIARHVAEGNTVDIVFAADGIGARGGGQIELEARYEMACQATKVLGAKSPHYLSFPDNQMDRIPLLDVVKKLEQLIGEIKPQIVYTHHYGDLNIDHKITCRSVLTSCRPTPESSVDEIYGFEILSSTEWAVSASNAFLPTCFVDISATFNQKMDALRYYDAEMREFPHSRSYESVEAQTALRGSQAGLSKAEAFTVIRKIVR